MSIKILLHHVLVSIPPSETQTESGIVIPTEVLNKERKAVEYGTVAQVGPTAFTQLGRDPSILSVGEKVSFLRYSGKSVIDSDGTDYILLNDDDILCVIE